MGGGKKVKYEFDAESLHCAGLFSENYDGEEWILCQKMSKLGSHSLCRLSGKGLPVCV
jgi:glutamine cyclotransferase